MKKFEGTATVRTIDEILADTDAVRARDAEIATLRAQLDAAEQRIAELEQWRPVEDGFSYLCQCPSCTFDAAYQGEAWRWELYVSGDSIGVCDPDNKDDDRSVELTPNLRLMVRSVS